MAILPSTLLFQEYVRDIRNTSIARWELASVGSGATAMYSLLAMGLKKGILMMFRIASTSAAIYDISVYNSPTGLIDTCDEIYRVVGINKAVQEGDIEVFFIAIPGFSAPGPYDPDNDDKGAPVRNYFQDFAEGALSPALYIEIRNSAGPATGIITVEMGFHSFS